MATFYVIHLCFCLAWVDTAKYVLSISDSPTGTPDTKSPYNNCEAFCTVVRSRLKDHSLGKLLFKQVGFALTVLKKQSDKG